VAPTPHSNSAYPWLKPPARPRKVSVLRLAFAPMHPVLCRAAAILAFLEVRSLAWSGSLNGAARRVYRINLTAL